MSPPPGVGVCWGAGKAEGEEPPVADGGAGADFGGAAVGADLGAAALGDGAPTAGSHKEYEDDIVRMAATRDTKSMKMMKCAWLQ